MMNIMTSQERLSLCQPYRRGCLSTSPCCRLLSLRAACPTCFSVHRKTYTLRANQSSLFGASLEILHRRLPSLGPKHLGRYSLKTSAIFEKFTEPTIKVVIRAQKEAQRLGDTEVTCYHIFLGLVDVDTAIDGFMDTGVTLDKARDAISKIIGDENNSKHGTDVPFSEDAKIVFESAMQLADEMAMQFVLKEHLTIALMLQNNLMMIKILDALNLRADAIVSVARSRIRGEKAIENPGAQKDPPGLFKFKTSRRRLASKAGKKSATPTLDDYSVDLCMLAEEGRLDPLVGRSTEVRRVMQILARRSKNNPILLGEAGVGKTAIAEGLALAIVTGSAPDGAPVPEFLKNKRVMQVDIALLLAGSKERGEMEKRVTKLVAEVKKSNDIILVIDEIHTMVGAGSVSRGSSGQAGGLDIANILKPALARGELQCIGATTIKEYRKHIESDKALARRFQPVNVGEPIPEDAVEILKGLRDNYEKHHQCVYTDRAIDAAIKLSVRYIADRYLPDKAIDLLDEAGSRARVLGHAARKANPTFKVENASSVWDELREVVEAKDECISDGLFEEAALLRLREVDLKSKISGHTGKCAVIPVVDVEDIEAIVSAWSGIPMQHLSATEEKRILNLGEKLSKEIIGQSQAVNAVSRAMRRAFSHMRDPKRPIASFLFCGPTGVGKTELTKVLAEHCFGAREKMIRLDMSEYMERHNVSKLIGAPPGYVGYNDGGKLTEPVRRNPYSLILLDEIEKAHADVFNILLQILEDGRLTDSQGRTVSFKNCVIVMTSNVGSNVISKGVRHIGFELEDDREKSSYRAMKALLFQEMKNYFKPELINRIDEVIVFEPLGFEDVKTVTDVILTETARRLEDTHKVRLHLTSILRDRIASRGFDPAYGARPLRREITRLVDDTLSDVFLGEGFSEGERVILDVGGEGKDGVPQVLVIRGEEAENLVGQEFSSVVLYSRKAQNIENRVDA